MAQIFMRWTMLEKSYFCLTRNFYVKKTEWFLDSSTVGLFVRSTAHNCTVKGGQTYYQCLHQRQKGKGIGPRKLERNVPWF